MSTIDLHRCARMNLVDEFQAALIKGVKLNEKDSFGATPLHYAITEKNSDVIALLLEHGADVTVQDSNGKTSLHYAIEHNLPYVAEALLKKNPGLIAIGDKFGNEPLWTASFNAKGKYELVALLLRYGADPNHRNNSNLSPLDIPKRKGDDVLLQILASKHSRQSQSSE